MSSKMVKGTLIYTLGALLPKIGAFLVLPIYSAYLSPSEWGVVSQFLILNGFFVLFFTLALPRALYRVYYDFSDEQPKKELVGTITIAVTVVGLLTLGLLILFSRQVEMIYASIPFFPYYFVALLLTLFQSLISIPVILLQVRERALSFVMLNVSFFLLRCSLILWFVVVEEQGAIGYLKGEMYASIVSLVVHFFVVRKHIVFKWNAVGFKSAFSFSLPLLPSLLATWVLDLSDRIFISHNFGSRSVGIYSMAYTIAGLVLIVSSSFRQAYDPYFFKIAKTMPEVEAKKVLYKTNNFFLVASILVSFSILFFSKEVITLSLDPAHWESYKIVPIISLSYVISQFSAIANTMMYQEKKTKYVMYATLASAALNVVLNIVLIPILGIYGAAWATVLAFLFNFVLSYRMAKTTYFIPFNWAFLVPLVVILTGIYFLFYFVEIEDVTISILLKFVALLLIAIPYLLYNKSSLLALIKTK